MCLGVLNKRRAERAKDRFSESSGGREFLGIEASNYFVNYLLFNPENFK